MVPRLLRCICPTSPLLPTLGHLFSSLGCFRGLPTSLARVTLQFRRQVSDHHASSSYTDGRERFFISCTLVFSHTLFFASNCAAMARTTSMLPLLFGFLINLTELPVVSAHGYVTNATIGGQTHYVAKNWDTEMKTGPGWDADNEDTGYVAWYNSSDPSVICHKGGKPYADYLTAAAGSTIDLQWNSYVHRSCPSQHSLTPLIGGLHFILVWPGSPRLYYRSISNPTHRPYHQFHGSCQRRLCIS